MKTPELTESTTLGLSGMCGALGYSLCYINRHIVNPWLQNIVPNSMYVGVAEKGIAALELIAIFGVIKLLAPEISEDTINTLFIATLAGMAAGYLVHPHTA